MTYPYGRDGQKGFSELGGINPAVKLLSLIFTLGAILRCNSLLGFAVAAAVTIAIVYISPLSMKAVLGSYKKLAGFFVFVLLINTLFYSERYSFARWWIFCPSVVGAIKGVIVVLKSLLAAALLEVFSSVIERSELSDVFAFILTPFSYIGLSAAKTAAAVTESVCLIPELLLLSQEVKAQRMAMGNTQNGRGKTGLIRTLSILTVFAMHNAERRAEYLDSRGLGLDGRTRPYFSDRIKQLKVYDLYAFLVCISLWALEVLVL